MFGGEESMYWIEYKLFVCLGSYSRPHIIGIKAGWFGLVWFNSWLYYNLLMKDKLCNFKFMGRTCNLVDVLTSNHAMIVPDEKHVKEGPN